MRIYKILDSDCVSAFRETGSFHGSADDARDGFIHFSTRHQLAGTLQKHYAGRANLTLVTVDQATLEKMAGAALRWEVARGGDRFPHLYAALPWTAVVETTELNLDSNGLHVLPRLAGEDETG